MKPYPLVANIFGGPGIGKSTVGAAAFAELKLRGFEVELVTEYAKDLVWEGITARLDFPIHVWAEQHHRIARLAGKVDVVVTDSPTLLSLYYAERNRSPWLSDEFTNLVAVEASRFPSVNIVLQRANDFRSAGRIHSEAESIEIDSELMSFVRMWGNGEIFPVRGNADAGTIIADIVSGRFRGDI